VPMSLRLVKYLRLFKPATRAMSMARTVKLLGELVPDIQRQSINAKGRDWRTDDEVWCQAFEVMTSRRDEGKLKLPLTSHAYLYEVVCGLAFEREYQEERERERERKNARRSDSVGEVTLAKALAALPLTPVPDYSKPSPHAQRLRAEIEAKRAAQAASTKQDGGTDE